MGNGILNVITKTDANFWKFAGRVGAASLAAGVAFKAGLMIPIIKGLAILYTAITALSIGEALEESFDLSTRFARIAAQMSAGVDNILTLLAGKLEGLSDEEIGEQLLERSEQLEKQFDDLTVETKSFVETLKSKIGENNDAFKNTVGQLLGTDDIDGTVSDIVKKYQDGVKEFEQISLENKDSQVDFGVDQEINKFGQLKDQVKDVRKELGKQVSFFVDLGQFKKDKRSSGRAGGVTSKSLRESGSSFREQINLNKFRKSFQETGNRFSNSFNGQLNESSPRNTQPRRVSVGRVEGLINRPAARQNIAKSVSSKVNQLSELVSLTKSGNETRNNILLTMSKISGGFGSV